MAQSKSSRKSAKVASQKSFKKKQLSSASYQFSFEEYPTFNDLTGDENSTVTQTTTTFNSSNQSVSTIPTTYTKSKSKRGGRRRK